MKQPQCQKWIKTGGEKCPFLAGRNHESLPLFTSHLLIHSAHLAENRVFLGDHTCHQWWAEELWARQMLRNRHTRHTLWRGGSVKAGALIGCSMVPLPLSNDANSSQPWPSQTAPQGWSGLVWIVVLQLHGLEVDIHVYYMFKTHCKLNH